MRHKPIWPLAVPVLMGLAILVGFGVDIGEQGNVQAAASQKALSENDRQISAHAQRMIEEGRQIFRFDTFGSEALLGRCLTAAQGHRR